MNTNRPFFSVVVPVYNKEPHIQRSISSVLAQTFQNFELILINDASTDNSLNEMRKFTDSRIRLLCRDKPGPGGYKARNLGIREAVGEWVAFLDADDEWFPQHLDRMKLLASSFPEVFFLSCGWQSQFHEFTKYSAYLAKYGHKGVHALTLSDYLSCCLKGTKPVWTSIVCIKKSSPIANNIFPENEVVRRGGDVYAWLKMMCYHKSMVWSNQIGAIYHKNAINMVTKTAYSTPYLMSRKVFSELTSNLNRHEKKLLKKYFNDGLKKGWFGNIKRGHQTILLLNHLYWRGDFWNALCLSLASIFLTPLLKFLFWMKKQFNE